MAELKEEMTINLPIRRVFNFLSDPTNRIDMYTNVVEVKKLTEDMNGVGSNYEEIRQLSNRRVGSQLELVEYEKNSKVGIVSDANGLKIYYYYKLEAVEKAKTFVTFIGSVQATTLRTKILKRLLVNMLKKEEKDHLLLVKKHLEDK
ncbi:hypothetical protein QA612_16465 [Evansella sp. AB-P1]|uniref:SRPBCC family protein n=1 Tax=Evansella sp. AB-P1 TaxID=3037653 RepID=UPI00241C2602|nr:SRPBCC family protein [Evansella sp. AB-P1]MDG5789053.1 hypothetical protein [Evansella sp. AB-P1]